MANSSSNVIFGVEEKFTDSNVYHWLNDYFYPHLKNSEKYIVKNASWCSNHAIFTLADIPNECNVETFQSPVGLLSIQDLLNSGDGMMGTYLSIGQSYWLLDRVNRESINITYTTWNDGFTAWDARNYGAVRPVIHLNTAVYIMSGSGTFMDPYKLNDYEYAKENEQIKDRLDGEYFSYSGYLFRKIDTDKDGNVKMIMSSNMKDPETEEEFWIGYANSITERKFDINTPGNVGHTLNEELLLHLSDKSIVSHEYEIPEIDVDLPLDQWKKTKVKSMLSLPTSYDLFSTYYALGGVRDSNFLLLDYSPSNDITFVNTGNGLAFTMDQNVFGENTVKVVLYLKGNLKIASGKGTYSNPYYIK